MGLRACDFPAALDQSVKPCLTCDYEGLCAQRSVCPCCGTLASAIGSLDPLCTNCLSSSQDELGKLVYSPELKKPSALVSWPTSSPVRSRARPVLLLQLPSHATKDVAGPCSPLVVPMSYSTTRLHQRRLGRPRCRSLCPGGK